MSPFFLTQSLSSYTLSLKKQALITSRHAIDRRNMENQKSMYPYVVLVILFLNIFFVMMSALSAPPLFSEIAKDMPLSKTEMGTIMGATTLAGIFMSPIWGGLADKIGCRWVMGLGGILAGIAGGLRYFAGSPVELMIYMFFLGAGGTSFMIIMAKVLSSWFPPQKVATMNAICFAGVTIGTAVAMGTAAKIMAPFFNGWRGTFLFLAVCSFIMGVLWLILYRDPQVQKGATGEKENMASNFKTVLKIRDIRLLAMSNGFLNICLMAVMALLPVTLQERGIANAGPLISIMMITSLITKLIVSVVSDKLGKRKLFLVLGGIVSGLCLPGYLVLTGISLIILLLFYGAVIGPSAPIIMTATVEVEEIGKTLSGTALGVVSMIATLGGFIGPVITGILMDATGSAWGGFIFLAVSSIVAGLIMLPARVR